MAAAPVRRSELGEALRACRNAFIGVGVMSCMINLLYLTGSIFMLEVYDRVLPSRSVPTLVGLVILAGGLYIAQGGLDLIRGRILGRIGTALDEALNTRVFETVVRLPLLVGSRNEGLQPLRDLDNVRSFLGSMGPGAFFDLPWLPFYLGICFAFHWLLGLTALVGAIILVALTMVTEFMSRTPAREAMTLAARRNDLATTSRRNAEVLVAMGMSGRLTKRWTEANETYLAGDQRLIVQDVTFAVEAGSGVGVIGPSGSGKSSLVRALVGVWIPFRGKVRLDGAALDQWSSDVLGRHVGYLPQDVELFGGSVAQNISRFDPEAKSEAIIAAARSEEHTSELQSLAYIVCRLLLGKE